MGTRFGACLSAIWLSATLVTAAVASRPLAAGGMGAAESPPRLVPIAPQAVTPLPRLVPITVAGLDVRPPPSRPSSPVGMPPLAAISYAPTFSGPAVLPPATPAPHAPVVIRSLPVADSLPVPLPVASTPILPPHLPVASSLNLPPPLPVASAPILPPPLPVPSALPPAADTAAIATTLPPPLPVLPADALPPPPAPVPPLPVNVPAVPAPEHVAVTPPPLPPASRSEPATAPPVPRAVTPGGGKPTDAIRIASFNIQVFGESKIAKQQVVEVLARVVRSFDVVAVQEVRAKSDSVIPQFVSAINADGSRYEFVIGPRLGRTVSKEQYTFIYDSTRIEIDPSSVGTSPNPGDRLHRPPLHARFRVRANPPQSGFSFWLVDTHTDPDEVSAEVNALADVFMEMKRLRPDEDDVILLGDFNAGPPQFGRLKQVPGVGWAISGVTTNTRRSKTYDNLVFDTRATTEYTGSWGVLDLQNTFGLSLDKALEVSDHNPVWAAFRPWETQQVAADAGPATR